jgi:hypothetical protein
VFAVLRDSECRAGVFGGGAIDMVGAGGRPVSIYLVISNAIQHVGCVLVVLLNVFHSASIAIGKRSSVSATNTEYVRQRPRIIGRLDGKERHSDVGKVVLGEHAFPLLSWELSHTLGGWRVDLFVGQLHKVLE